MTSAFASILRRLLDETGVFKRAEWAGYLNVSESAISQWLNDRTMPKAEHLRKVLWVMRNADDIPIQLINSFERMSDRPLVDVTPLYKSTRSNTISEYVLSPLIEGFLHELRRLPSREQERFILRMSEMCSEESKEYRVPNIHHEIQNTTLS